MCILPGSPSSAVMRFTLAVAVLACPAVLAGSPALLRGAGLSSPDLCPYIAPVLPSECVPNDDCTAVKCTLNWDQKFVFSAIASLDLCAAAAASASLELDLEAPIRDSWSHKWALDESERLPVPGASIDIMSFGVGLFANGEIAANAASIRVSLSFDLCASVFSYSKCGQDLAYYLPSLQPYIPFYVLNHTFALDDLCGNTRPVSVCAAPANESTRALQETRGGAAGCCGVRCSSDAECASDLFCCPNHGVCMDPGTKSTRGPACDACAFAVARVTRHRDAKRASEVQLG